MSRVRKVTEPPGDARPDWWVFREVARRMGQEWEADNAAAIWDDEISVLAPQLVGVKYARLEADGLQWPVPSVDHPGTPTLHKDGCFTCGLGNLTQVDWRPPAEVADAGFPFVLSTGRRLYQYHTRTQTGRCEGLDDLYSEETADISPQDAADLGVSHGDVVRVSSRRGAVEVKARVTGEVPRGVVWMTFHFREGNANWLTNAVYDPVSMTAEYKACAVNVERV